MIMIIMINDEDTRTGTHCTLSLGALSPLSKTFRRYSYHRGMIPVAQSRIFSISVSIGISIVSIKYLKDMFSLGPHRS